MLLERLEFDWRSSLGFGVSGFGFRARILSFGLQLSGFGSRVSGFGFRVSGTDFVFQVSGGVWKQMTRAMCPLSSSDYEKLQTEASVGD